MSEFVINCPKCGKGLKLRDRSKLGKKAGCPKCNHVFVLQLPPDDNSDDEVEFELAGDSVQNQTLVGTEARWIPDKPAASSQTATKSAKSKSPARPAPVAAPERDDEPPQEEFDHEPPSRAAKLAKKQMPQLPKIKLTRKQKTRLISAVATILVIVGGVWAAMSAAESKTTKRPKGRPTTVEIASDDSDSDDADDSDVDNTKEEVAAATPINLWGLPMGARLIVSIRPSELWESKSRGEEVRFCLGPFGSWVEAKLKELGFGSSTKGDLTKGDLTKVEHMLVGVIPGEVGTVPAVAAVVRFKADIANSQFINDYGGTRNDSYGYPVYVYEKSAVVRKPNDPRTIAICPVQFAQELAQSVQQANAQSDGIDALIPMTDETRHLTILFEPVLVDRHHQAMFPPNTHQVVRKGLDWFDKLEIETVAWTMHFGKEKFDSKILMRNFTGASGIAFSESSLDKSMRGKVKKLPFDLWHEVVDKMNPTVMGHRKLIGRFPAMMQMFAKSTKGGYGTRYAMLETSLPERAAPNIALAALLTWDQSLVTDFSLDAPKPGSGDDKLPELVIDRLKRKIDIEFARAPLQDAFKYIAEECKVNHDIDGDALKDKGYTKNMPQTFTMQDTGLAAIKKIVSGYKDMCLVIDEQKKEFIITTTTFAEKNKQKPYEF